MTLKDVDQSTLPMFTMNTYVPAQLRSVQPLHQGRAPTVSSKQNSFQDMKFAFHG